VLCHLIDRSREAKSKRNGTSTSMLTNSVEKRIILTTKHLNLNPRHILK
jgi:hypothetical protein